VRIAVVGAGVSGLVCAFLLARAHDVVLYEKEPRLGGHTNTVLVRHEDHTWSVDTGFIVFNTKNYPRLSWLLDLLGVESRPTTMSFSVRDDDADFEYGGSSIGGLVGTPKNLVNPRWWSVVRGVATLGRQGKTLLAEVGEVATVSDLVRSGRFSRGFLDDYLIPMAGAIWSAPRDCVLAFPAKFLLRFFDNHGMLDLRERPQWRTIVGGSRKYIDAMMGVLARSARVAQDVRSIRRTPAGVVVRTATTEETFDEVVLATHSDQALAILADASEKEREILSRMPYQPNEAVLHTDASALPRRRHCWAAWNYRVARDSRRPVAVTYNMSILQGLETTQPICVTLNDTSRLDPKRVIARFQYHHPIYTLEGDRARTRWQEISGVQHTHFCGAYWGNGFHEDGVASALRVCERLGVRA
jgi:hypothetical protein